MADITDIQNEKLEQLEESVRVPTAVIDTDNLTDPDVIFNELIKRVKKYHPNTDISLIEKAYEWAEVCHKEQKRKSGESYIIHPMNVALILADLEMDKETIVAGILHDVVEDTEVTIEDIEWEFNKEIALLVDGVTKLGQLSYKADSVEIQAENLRKMFLAMAKDIRVIIIKFADRLHNMRTLQYMSPQKQKEKAKETLEIYSPLARRLGISKVKTEMDDLALKYMEPEAYYDLVEKIALRKAERDSYVEELVDSVKKHLDEVGIEATVDGRAKHFFSIYKKMVTQHKTIDQIHDLFAIRIIVDSIKDCYAALGMIHEMYTPIPGRFKDYIAMPKPNMYQSLHSTVIGTNGTPFEIQIRTKDMHRTSEYGIAAHWKYKESGDGATINGEEEKLSWLRQILEWQQEMSDNKEFVSLLKDDLNLFSDTVFCFTPQGDIKNLPMGSTPIDFAYSVHSAVGNRMVGAKVNGKLVPINYKIKNGDRLEIITSNNSKGPSMDWINIVKSTQAKNKINQFFRHINKEENINRGKELIAEYCKAKGIDYSKINKPAYQKMVLKRYSYHDWDALMAGIGQGSLKEGQIIHRLEEIYNRENPIILSDDEVLEAHKKHQNQGFKRSKSGVLVRGLYDVSVRLSGCCNPVPGDEIVGFVTRGRGVTVHRTDCINVINLMDIERSRLIDVEWEDDAEANEAGGFSATIHIFANDRFGLLNDIVRMLTGLDINIQGINSHVNKQNIVTLDLTIFVGGREQLQRVTEKLRTIEGIIDVERSSG